MVKLVEKATGTAVPATVTYSPVAKKVILNSTESLTKGASYTATVNRTARDLAGNRLAAAKVWRFTLRR